MGNTCQSQVLLSWVLVYSAKTVYVTVRVCMRVCFPSGDLLYRFGLGSYSFGTKTDIYTTV